MKYFDYDKMRKNKTDLEELEEDVIFNNILPFDPYLDLLAGRLVVPRVCFLVVVLRCRVRPQTPVRTHHELPESLLASSRSSLGFLDPQRKPRTVSTSSL